MHTKRTSCRACGGADLRPFLVLGPQPLANSFLLSPDAPEPRFPLDVSFCASCSLVQLLDVISPEVLFRDYVYVTGFSDTMKAHYKGYSKAVVEALGLGEGSRVVEVASNDGGLLECFREHGVSTLGIEPARNIAEIARGRGIETIAEFFSGPLAEEVAARRGLVDAVIANNVLAHVDDTRGFLAAARTLIKPGGRVIVEAPYLRPMLDHLEYDTVYHEHLCYFSVNALLLLFESAGMRIARIDQMAIHGGSLRVWGAPVETQPEHGAAVREMAETEAAAGMTSFARYEQFARDVEESRAALTGLLRELKSQGKVVAGYGAPAKGNTLLNYCGIGTDLLPYTFDRSTLKAGKFTPGMHIPVLPPEEISSRRPDYLLILPWNIADEIMTQQRAFQEAGGRFILPIPKAHIL